LSVVQTIVSIHLYIKAIHRNFLKTVRWYWVPIRWK